MPNTIMVDGKSFLIKTDFREWVKFGEIIKKEKIQNRELFYLFPQGTPDQPFMKELIDFYISKNATPTTSGGGDVKIIDYVLDGSYIYGSFMGAYGIDLVDVEQLHWHKFSSLLSCLPDTSKMSYIMQTRCYKPTSTKQEELLARNQLAWALPIEQTQEEIEELEKFSSLFI